MPQKHLQISVLIPPATMFARGLLRGIIEYARRCGRWRFLADTANPPLGRQLPTNQRIDGVIGPFHQPEHREAVDRLGLPAVNISAGKLSKPMPTVASNYERAGDLAAEHLLERGFKHFACWGGLGLPDRCFNGYYMRLREAGYEPAYHPITDAPWDQQDQQVEKWLEPLPKPLGVLTTNDALGLNVLHTCDRIGLRVPDDVAVIGVTNDELLCEMCSPPLSSVALAVERQGYMAAELLDQLMAGEPAPTEPLFVQPQDVVTRQSTEVMVVDDPDLVAALQYIRKHATDPIRVDDVLASVPISRRSLESRFHNLLGRGPAAEIRRVQLERAKQLLSFSDMPIARVAAVAGFSSPEYMTRVFQRTIGTAPRDYRMRGRIR